MLTLIHEEDWGGSIYRRYVHPIRGHIETISWDDGRVIGVELTEEIAQRMRTHPEGRRILRTVTAKVLHVLEADSKPKRRRRANRKRRTA